VLSCATTVGVLLGPAEGDLGSSGCDSFPELDRMTAGMVRAQERSRNCRACYLSVSAVSPPEHAWRGVHPAQKRHAVPWLKHACVRHTKDKA
jgi:hypothetical protein